MSAQRFVDYIRTQFESSMMPVMNVKYHGVPDEDNTYHFRFEFNSNHSQDAMEEFVKDVAADLSGGITYEVKNVRRQTKSEFVFIIKIS